MFGGGADGYDFCLNYMIAIKYEVIVMRVMGVIPARYESSRFPGKPLALIHGRPMIWWVYDRARRAEGLDDICVATDDKRIYDVCVSNDMKVVMTSGDICTGADRVAEVAKKHMADIYINIQGDEPLIKPEAIEQIISYMKTNNDVYYLGLKSRLSDEVEWKNYNVVKAITDANGDAMYFSRTPIPTIFDLGISYRVMGLYGYRREFLLTFVALGQSPLEKAEKGVEMLRAMENGYKVRLIDTEYQSIGVDLPEHIIEIEKRLQKEV